LARNNLLNYARLVPIVGKDSVEVIEGMRATGAARDATRQYLKRTNMPLFTSGFSSSVRPTVVDEVGEETTSPSLKSIVDSAPASVIDKLNQAAATP
jgi:hypothetical protein